MLVNIIGSGNVATHMALHLVEAGHETPCVVSRDMTRAARLADMIGAKPSTDIAALPEADVTLVAVSDNNIPAVAQSLARAGNRSLIAHTSGATPLDALLPNAQRAVLYPCQTFSTADEVDIRQVPFLIEASDARSLATTTALVESMRAKAIQADSRQRAMLHVAAVFACNFTNPLLLTAQRLMDNADLPFETLRPLVEKTIAKAFETGPLDAQTGPARRGDTITLNRHEKMIEQETEREIYSALSRSIYETYHKRK